MVKILLRVVIFLSAFAELIVNIPRVLKMLSQIDIAAISKVVLLVIFIASTGTYLVLYLINKYKKFKDNFNKFVKEHLDEKFDNLSDKLDKELPKIDNEISTLEERLRQHIQHFGKGLGNPKF